MNKIDAQALLAEMRVLAEQASAQKTNAVQNEATNGISGFQDLLQTQIEKVNNVQQTASDLAERYVMGDQEVTLAQAMIAQQKSSVYTQFTIETRNQLVKAYNDIMNMSV